MQNNNMVGSALGPPYLTKLYKQVSFETVVRKYTGVYEP